MLNYAVQANPRGLVLFSSTNPSTIHENVRSVSESSYSAGQLRRFAELVDEMPRAEK